MNIVVLQLFCKHIYKQIKKEYLEDEIIHVYMYDKNIKYRVVGITEECIKCLKRHSRKTKIFENDQGEV